MPNGIAPESTMVRMENPRKASRAAKRPIADEFEAREPVMGYAAMQQSLFVQVQNLCYCKTAVWQYFVLLSL